MLAPTAAPWTAERISRTMIHVFGARDRDGSREVVAIVNATAQDANAALICAAPEIARAVRENDLAAALATLTDRGLA
jgi:hypothetical protein